MKKCPVCKLVSPDSASQCDCGHKFVDSKRQIELLSLQQDWWFVERDTKMGPLPLSEIIDYFRSNRIKLDSLVWRPGWNEWKQMIHVDEILPFIVDMMEDKRKTMPPPIPKKYFDTSCKENSQLPMEDVVRKQDKRVSLLIFLFGFVVNLNVDLIFYETDYLSRLKFFSRYFFMYLIEKGTTMLGIMLIIYFFSILLIRAIDRKRQQLSWPKAAAASISFLIGFLIIILASFDKLSD